MIYLLIVIFIALYGISILTVGPGLGRWWAKSFIGWWGILLCVSATNPFDLYDVSADSYLLFCLFVVSYFLGFAIFLSKKKMHASGLYAAVFFDYRRLVANKYFKILLVLLVFVLLSYAYKYSQYIALAGSFDSRVARFEVGKVFGSSYEIILFEYFVGTLIWFLKFVVAFGVVFSASRNLAWFLSFISCALYMSFGAGRNIAIEIGLLIIFLMALRKYSNIAHESYVSKYKVVLFVAILYLASVFATYSRMAEGSISLDGFIEANFILLEHAVVYFVGSIRAFDYAYSNYQNIFLYSYPEDVRKKVLSVRPGITDRASIEFKDENDILGKAANPEQAYIQEVLPIKQRFYIDYVETRSFWGDIGIIFQTIWAIVRR